MNQRIDRRHFLLGTAGAVLAVPMLESLSPRGARGQPMTPPKRLVIVLHSNGRLVANGRPADWWSPGPSTRALSAGAAPSPMLAELAPIADRIVTVDGIDNRLRHASGDADGHFDPERTLLTNAKPVSYGQGGGPSLDYVAGLRLRSGPGMRASVVIPASATPEGAYFEDHRCWGEGGTRATTITGNPEYAVGELFGERPPPEGEPPPSRPSLRDRLNARRGSLLDGVRESLSSLRGRVSTRDRERLDRHADFIQRVQARVTAPATMVRGASCMRPDETMMPHVTPSNWEEYTRTGLGPEFLRGRQDSLTTPYQIENLVQALACDVVRSAVFTLCGDPEWSSEFPGGSPFSADDSVHGTVHGTPRIDDSSETMSNATNLRTGFQAFGRQFRSLVERLGEMEDVDGTRLLDNTLVLWISELGYGSEHTVFNLPVVLAGMPGAFDRGQGRHVVEDRRSTGDLHAQVLRMLGGSDTSFGPTGTIGSLADEWGTGDIHPDYGLPDFIERATPLHSGPLDL